MYVVFVVYTELDTNLLNFFIEKFNKFYILDFTKIKPLFRFCTISLWIVSYYTPQIQILKMLPREALYKNKYRDLKRLGRSLFPATDRSGLEGDISITLL